MTFCLIHYTKYFYYPEFLLGEMLRGKVPLVQWGFTEIFQPTSYAVLSKIASKSHFP